MTKQELAEQYASNYFCKKLESYEWSLEVETFLDGFDACEKGMSSTDLIHEKYRLREKVKALEEKLYIAHVALVDCKDTLKMAKPMVITFESKAVKPSYIFSDLVFNSIDQAIKAIAKIGNFDEKT